MVRVKCDIELDCSGRAEWATSNVLMPHLEIFRTVFAMRLPIDSNGCSHCAVLAPSETASRFTMYNYGVTPSCEKRQPV